MEFWIFYVMIFTSIARYVEACELSIDDTTRCTYVMTCDSYIDMDWSYFQTNPRDNMYWYGGMEDEIVCPRPVLYHGYQLYPVYLVMRYSYSPVPPNDWEQDVINIIYGLDLSNLDYSKFPILTKMKNLVKLNLSHNNLASAQLSNIDELIMLSEIDLSYNKISEIQINYEQYPFKNLININLSHNLLEKLPDGILSTFHVLQKLDVSHNYIDIITESSFGNMSKIELLDMSNNKLTSIHSSLLRFDDLKFLNLSHNNLNELNLNDFEPLRKLEILDLSSNNIAIIYVANFISFNSLISIDLSKNKLKHLPPGLFANTTVLTFSIEENSLEGALEKGMLQGINVQRLHLERQFLTEINDYAFYDNTRLDTLLLQSNNIQTLSKMSLKNLINLIQLDLSDNKITNLDFDKEDLKKLQTLLLKNNQLTKIEQNQLQYLDSLEYLDLSDNYISRIEPGSFQSLTNLINLCLNHNPLVGTLDTGMFNGLESLPSLDLSYKMISKLENATFNNMIDLKNLNMSHCQIEELQYNTFTQTGNLETLDLSYNKLEDFSINITQILKISTLLLKNNFIKSLTLSTLKRTISYPNIIENVYNETFNSLLHLTYLDVSYNNHLIFTVEVFKNKNVDTLDLSGVKTHINLAFIMKHCTITNLIMSNGSVESINELNLSKLSDITSLDLSYNNVSTLRVGAFTNLTSLKFLDLSFNRITFIQPGVFKDNSDIKLLNISHNLLSFINYGIFRGLINVQILDLSYNNIRDLKTERFYEVESLTELIADHNKIDFISAFQFAGTNLQKLSIGDNPLSCDILVNLQVQKKSGQINLDITALKIDEHGHENVNGVTCNKRQENEKRLPTKTVANESVINVTPNILTNYSNKIIQPETSVIQHLEKIASILGKLSTIIELNNKTNLMINNTNMMLNESNVMLNRIMHKIPDPPIVIPPNIYLEKTTKSASLDTTHIPIIGNDSTRNANETTGDGILKTESGKLVSSNTNSQSIFTETCVGLILFILVGFVLYKFYRSRELIRNRLMLSRHEVSGSEESSAL